MESKLTTEERIWAVLSHLSALALGMGILLPIIGWSEQRQKSKYVAFQCLQALGYQSLGYTFWLLGYLVLMVIYLVGLVVLSGISVSRGYAVEDVQGLTSGLLVLLIMGTFGLYFLFPIIAAVACALGRDFRYPLLGNRLAKYLGYDMTDEDNAWLIEDHEDRWVAAMGHFAVIIALWGMIAPAAAWIIQGKRSLFLKFQSVQTLIYQGLVNLLYIGSGFIAVIGLFPIIILVGLESNQGLDESTGMIGLFFFLLIMLVAALMVFIVPLFHILGQWAGYRVLKGDNYHYPILGRLVEKRLQNKDLPSGDDGSKLEGETA